MPVHTARQAVTDSARFMRRAVEVAAPKAKENAPRTTARDVGTLGLSTALLNVIVWVANDIAGVHIPDHVTVSIAAIVAYFIARKFEY